jgi:hypothetical protein
MYGDAEYGGQKRLFNLTSEDDNLDVANLTLMAEPSATHRIFEFTIANNGSLNLSDVNWSLNTGTETVHANQLINLTSNESIYIYNEYNFTQVGEYEVSATATDGAYSDSEAIDVEISPLNAYGLISLYSLGYSRIFEFSLEDKQDWNLSFSNINWSFDTGESVIIADQLTSMVTGEIVFYYTEYNYTSGGNYEVNLTATNTTYADSEQILITI